jgi:hypothetical protein
MDSNMWQWFKDNGLGFSAMAAIVAAVVGIWAIINSKKDSRDKSRPVVVAELQRHREAETHIMIVVRNAGATVAKDVVVTFDPALTTEPTDANRYANAAQRMFADPIPTMGPGQLLTNPWYHKEVDGAPDRCTVTATYKDTRKRKFEDEYILAIAPYRASLLLSADDSVRGRLKIIAEQSKKQTVAIQSIAGDISQESDHRWSTMEALREQLNPGGAED